MAEYDLVLRGGHVIDPANARDGVMDVAISGGRVARVAPAIEDLDARSIDVSGRYVTPGLIDIHVHVYPHWGDFGPKWQASVIPEDAALSALQSSPRPPARTADAPWS